MFQTLSNLKKASFFFAIVMTLTLAVTLFFRTVAPRAEIVVLINMLTPLLAAILMLFAVTRDGYTRSGRSVLGFARSGWKSWGWAFLLPLAVLAASYGLGWLSGLARLALPSEEGRLAGLLMELPIMLVFSAALAAGEEIGFRGYLLPQFRELGPRRAALYSGFLHGAWHLPVILLTPFYLSEGNRFLTIPVFLLLLTAAGMIYGGLRLETNSIWPAILLHGAFNTFLNVFSGITAPASPLTVYVVGESGLLTLLATAGVAFWFMYHRQFSAQHVPVSGPSSSQGVNG